MSIRILLADDHEIMRSGLRSLLGKNADLDVVGEASNGQEAVRMAKQLIPNVVIMDVSMPDLNGIEATRKIVSENSAIRVVALSMHSDEKFVTEMLQAGAAGYVLKESAFEELVNSINSVVQGHTYLSPLIAGPVVSEYLELTRSKESSPFNMLTDREREVLQLLAEGKSTKEIAGTLSVSAKTVDVHRSNIMDKLNLRSIAELTKYAIRAGLTSLEA